MHLRLSVAAVIVFCSLFSGTQSGFAGLGDRRKTQAQAHYMMGLFYENQGRLDEALSEYAQTLKLEKDIANAYLRRGAVFIRKGDFKSAGEELVQAKELQPQDLEIGFTLALVYTLQNSPESAAREFEEVLKKASQLEPGNISILKNLAGLYYQQKKIPEALAVYQLILGLDKADYEALFLWGSLLEESGKRPEAMAKFKEALKIKADYPEALNSLGYLYAEDSRNLPEAEEMLKQALAAEPDNGAYLDSLGWVYYKMNKIGEAREYLEKAGGLLSDPVIYDHLGEAYFKQGQPDKAGEAWRKSLELDPGQEKVKAKLNNLKVK